MILESIMNFEIGLKVVINLDNHPSKSSEKNWKKNRAAIFKLYTNRIGTIVKIEDNIIWVRWEGVTWRGYPIKNSRTKKYNYSNLKIWNNNSNNS